jgi:hypothetical protein
MRARNPELRRVVLAAVLVLASAAGNVRAGEGADPNVDAEAMRSVERMSELLAKTAAFSVTLDVGYDVVQAWGQKIEFGETRMLTVRRPDRLRVDTTERDGSKSGVVFDGRQIAAFDVSDGVYATAPQPGTLDDAIAHFVDDLGMRLPMAPILQGRLAGEARGWAREIRYIEASAIAGVPCDHVALRGDWEDVQLWIARGDRPLLQRIVITYHRAEGRPQFWAQFASWKLSPRLKDAVFAFTPPEGATKIAFRPRHSSPHAPAQPAGNQP